VVNAQLPTRVELKGAQVIPPTVREAVAELNALDLGCCPRSLCPAIQALLDALALPLKNEHRELLSSRASGDKAAAALARSKISSWPQRLGDGDFAGYCASLRHEQAAVKALEMQLNVIDSQVQFLEARSHISYCVEQQLQHEVQVLRQARAVVDGERTAANCALKAALREMTDTSSYVKVHVDVDAGRAAQSLNGYGAKAAAQDITRSLAHSGAWAHYAAHQFATMLAREQDLHDDFVCFYHSYSLAALLYEVHSVVARKVYGLPTDFAPLPRLSMADTSACTSLQALLREGGKDSSVAFRALGLSASCSVFASSSEAPPLQCFQTGYSCHASFRQLLIDFLLLCARGTKRQAEGMADAVVSAGRRHGLDTGCFSRIPSGGKQLTGYMLQIFVHRSIAERHVYPSKPYGTPIAQRILDYVGGEKKRADGQARIFFHPPTFVDPKKTRLFHYCARPLQSCMDGGIAASRGSLIQDLEKALQPLFASATPDTIAKRLRLH